MSKKKQMQWTLKSAHLLFHIRSATGFARACVPCYAHPMMDRAQRISFEILDCALNRATHRGGCAVNMAKFVERLRELFPDIEAREFSQACKSLVAENALDLRLGQRIYEGKEDDVFFADNASLLLAPAPLSYARFRRLSGLIEAPAGIRPLRERRGG